MIHPYIATDCDTLGKGGFREVLMIAGWDGLLLAL